MDSRVEELKGAVEEVRNRIRTAADELEGETAVEELQSAVKILMSELSDLQTQLERTTRKNPMMALGGALAVGWLLGNTFSKK
ncbi:hypothetical protein [Parvularcula maris]|uniref:DUF883 domain-containing protein n=1 Tax=Parvularcula maris TaxID=2965077 RepID=A0A9X2RI04_9PROT|nr:hypothetical protein [Parvularcula maris]MCQ8184426.1 hypothetical protein [Parvularcula maris]